jgi:hypothetical protein
LYNVLEGEGEQTGLNINADKTKYMKTSRNQIKRPLQNLATADYDFKNV